MDLYIVNEKGWPVLRFVPPDDPRFRVIATFPSGKEEAALSLLDKLTAATLARYGEHPGSASPQNRV